MLIKLTGILMLLSFLMVKGTSLMMYSAHYELVVMKMDQEAGELPDDPKEQNQNELSFDDEIAVHFLRIEQFLSSEKLNHFSFPETIKMYLSLPNPPPNILVGTV